jgi:hypothetical protein
MLVSVSESPERLARSTAATDHGQSAKRKQCDSGRDPLCVGQSPWNLSPLLRISE